MTVQPTAASATTPPCRVHLDYDPRVNYAVQQNDVPVLRRLGIENLTDGALSDLTVQVTSDPDFSAALDLSIDRIEAGARLHLPRVDLKLSPSFLVSLDEATKGHLWVEVTAGGETLVREGFPIELLAYDQWSGLRSLPEMLAAFVMPNHPAIEAVLAEASTVIEGWTGSASLDGYQSKDRRRVWTLGAAVFAALQARGLRYSSPPASFQDVGQKIRTPDRVFESGVATCLDLTVLAAACLEQVGLHPVIAFQDGHSFPGFWLLDEVFGESALDDLQHIRKRSEIGELCFFESTLVTSPESRRFADAVEETRSALEDEAKFLCLVDITAARRNQIRPLPSRSREGVGVDPEEPRKASALVAPVVPDLPLWTAGELGDPVDDASQSRLERWKRRLLDLSLRNRLLNFRDTKKTLPVMCPNLAQLEDRLAEGKAFRVAGRPDLMSERDGRDAEAFRERTGDDPVERVLLDAIEQRRVHIDLSANELERRLIEIFRAARLSREEGGANTLYLALGFLHWRPAGDRTKGRICRAPILLIPVDLERKSVRSGFRLRIHDDDPRINVTLVQMLETDLGLEMPDVESLPTDDSGVDVAAILQLIRQVVRDLPGWEVRDEAQVGLFSFTKYLMWKDLHDRTPTLLENRVVEHLVERPNEPFPVSGEFPELERLDDEHPPSETFCPMSADSSQLAAVFAAANGRNFVLEGPPGTGKSQTITNLIAHVLAVGKRVLFVSEKTAALEVVHRRLEQVGLGRFCLEIHSNKARKSEVLAQIGRALEDVGPTDPDDWAREATRLAELRADLNQYARAIHEPYPCGLSVFRATSLAIGLREVAAINLVDDPDNAARLGDAATLDRDRWAAMRESAERASTAAAESNEVVDSSWLAAQCEEWSPAWSRDVESSITELVREASVLGPCAEAWAHRLGLAERGWSADSLEELDELAVLFGEAPTLAAAALNRRDWATTIRDIETWLAHGRQRDALEAQGAEKYEQQALDLDIDDLESRWRIASASMAVLRWWRGRSVKKALRSVARHGRIPNSVHVAEDLALLRRWRDEVRTVESSTAAAESVFGSTWNDGRANWDALRRAADWASAVRQLSLRVAETARRSSTPADANRDPLEFAESLRERWARLLTEGRDLLSGDGPVAREMSAYRVAFGDQRGSIDDLTRHLQLRPRAAWGELFEPDHLSTVTARAEEWRQALPELRNWCAWRRARRSAVERGLAPLIREIEHGRATSGTFLLLFERSVLTWWIDEITEREPVLRQFFSPEHGRKIRQFAEVDERFMDLTKELIAARLSARVPDVAAARDVAGSEVGIIHRELQKKRRHLPIRTLLAKTANVLHRLKPCFLMSPLSVAQYLDPSFPRFDLVVFDEASQIPVWDAVGAIARGEKVVVVGDPKQLPPTNFFGRQDDEDLVDEDAVEDLESILDDCMGAGLPVRRLDWHYRSRHESLISFSNYHYYDNRLLTFPAPATEDSSENLGVSFRLVEDGVYDKGKSRTNAREAEAVVAEVVRRLCDSELCGATIGIVTFSQAQQTRIEDLLDQARRSHPEIEPYFSGDRQEPLFVKNLENVQGDERDVIFFSICYGPDSRGKMSMNFGPLNRQGGERRLNVAVTRARREVVVFSSIHGDAIDLARTRARGVRDLKTFLDYAERGYRALGEAVSLDRSGEFDSPFEKTVGDALIERGWQVHSQVGASGYRIDLAVVDPRVPGRYLLGIECDGASYQRAKTARDRDRLRQLVLEGLGWQLYRIWSTDWWSNPKEQIDKIVELLEARAAEPWQSVSPAAPEEPARAEDDADGASENVAENRESPYRRAPLQPAVELRAAEPLGAEPYVMYVASERRPSESLYLDASREDLRGVIREIVAAEGPIAEDLLVRRVADTWQFERSTSKLRRHVVANALEQHVTAVRESGAVFYWPTSLDRFAYDRCRGGADGDESPRKSSEIAPEEIAAAARQVLSVHVALPEEALCREAARLFGITRLTEGIAEDMRGGLVRLLDAGEARRDGDRIVSV